MKFPRLIKRQIISAFTLLELLTVMAIVGLVLGMSVPTLSTLAWGSEMTRAVSGVAGVLDLARGHAVSKNTYTWVVMAADTSGTDRGVVVAVLGSQDGSNTADGTVAVDLDIEETFDLSADSDNIVLLRRVAVFPKVTMERLLSGLAPEEEIAVEANDAVRFRLDSSASKPVTFLNENPDSQKVIQFNPNGQARVSGGLVQSIEVGIKALRGETPDETNVSAIRVSGVTGQTKVYRQ